MPVAYMIIFADATTPLVQDLFGAKDESVRSYVVIAIGVILLRF